MALEIGTIIAIQLSDLIVNPDFQPRVAGTDRDHVLALEETAGTWPPVVVVRHGNSYLLVDGFHRVCAGQNKALEAISVRVVEVPADGDLHALAFRLNAVHGRPLSLEDRRAFAQRCLRQDPTISNLEVSRRAGLSPTTVGTLRERLEKAAAIELTDQRVARTGYEYRVRPAVHRRPGELPAASGPDVASDAVGRVFTASERQQQRQIVSYLQGFLIALQDRFALKGWESDQDAAEACRLVLGPAKAAGLGQQLANAAQIILQVAMALGYEPEAR